MLIVQNTKKLLEHIFPTAETKLGMQGYMPRQLSEATNKVPNIEILDSQFEYKFYGKSKVVMGTMINNVS